MDYDASHNRRDL